MAEQLKFAWLDEAANWGVSTPVDTSTLDLLSLLAWSGYRQAISTDGSPVDETLTLNEQGSTLDGMADAVQALDAYLSRPGDLADYPLRQSIWLRAQQPGETRARQAQVLQARRPKDMAASGAYIHALKVPYIFGLSRTGWWENTISKGYSGSGLSALGGTLAYTALAGDRPARVARAQFSSSSALVEFWAGVQTDRLGETPSYFDPIWNLHLGSVRYGADTSGASDSSAEDGTKVVVTFSTVTTLAPRVSVVAADLGSHAAQRGKYVVKLRARCTSTLQSWVTLDNGYLDPGGDASDPLNIYNPGLRQKVAGTDWQLYPVGQVTLPAGGIVYGTIVQLTYAGLQISAEKISGSGNLELDCLVLVPCLDGYIHVIGTTSPADGAIYELYTAAAGGLTGQVQVYTSPFVTPVEELHPDQIRFGLRPTFGTIVVAGQRNGVSTKGDTLNLALDVYERWITLRGDEGYSP
jgi:hypothetical protein